MKLKKYSFILILAPAILLLAGMTGCGSSSRLDKQYPTDTLSANAAASGDLIEFSFMRGPEHNHPLMAVWIEDESGKYIQTLYVAESIAKGVFGHGDKKTGKWLPGPIRRPAALPVWAHRRDVKEADGWYVPTQETAIPDAYTGATPQNNFLLRAKTDKILPETFYVYFEVNQTWDWNEYWTNDKYPDDPEYKTSCQPALVYRAKVSRSEAGKGIPLELIGHSHYAGKDGSITEDLSTITTAKEIAREVSVRLVN
ncbi:MAG: hypothetical protein JW801_04180 [Bacteroidales bacterium]|nr:hypothetical protein [Bacteroidales bacterium]